MPGGTAAAGGLQQGSVSHSVPLELPPAPAGLVPDLSLVADVHAADGWLGPNWALAGFSRIERHSVLGGVPSFDGVPGASADSYTVDGMRLWDNTTAATSGAPTGAFWSTTVWEPEVQDGRVFDYDASDNVWRARSHGWTWEYGSAPEDHAVELRTEPDTATCGTACGADTSAWLLRRVTDPFGNQMEFAYAELPPGVSAPMLSGTSDPVLGGEFAYSHVPVSVRYGGSLSSSVTFTWGERPDVLMDARSGRIRVLPGRVEEIASFTGGSSAGDGDEFSRYTLQYQDDAGATACAGETYTAATSTSVLKRVFRVGDAGTPSEVSRELRCIEANEDASTWGSNPDYLIGASTALGTMGSRAQVVNFDGDPWPDILIIGSDLGSALELGYMFGSRDGLTEGTAPGATAGITESLLEGADATEDDYSGEGDPGWREPGSYALVDLDRNGTTDVVLAGDTYVSGEVDTELADGSTASETLDLGTHPGRLVRMAQWADVDGDGFVDLVLPANDLLDYDTSVASLPGYVLGSSHWIRNSGAPPYLSDGDLQALVLPFEDASSSDLADLYATDCATGEAEPPAHYYDSGWRWQQRWAQWGDYNADGVADVAYGVHACWTDTGVEIDSDYHHAYNASALYSRIFYGDGQGSFTDAGYGPEVGFDQLTFTAVSSTMAVDTGIGCDDEFDLATCVTDLTTTQLVAVPTEGFAALDLDRSGQTDLVLNTSTYEGYVGIDGNTSSTLAVYADEGVSVGFTHTGEDPPGRWLYHDTALVQWAEEDRLLADFDGDGFIDELALRDVQDLGDAWNDPVLYSNQRTAARHRITRIHDAYGGEISYTWTTSSLSGENPDVTWPVEVIDTVTDSTGTTAYTFDAGIFWGAENRFMGFRDATATRDTGASSTWRFIVQPWAPGALAWSADWGQDGSTLLDFHYVSYMHGIPDVGGALPCAPPPPPPPPPPGGGPPINPPPPPEGPAGPGVIGGGPCIPGPAPVVTFSHSAVDTVAPFFNPPRRQCDMQFGTQGVGGAPDTFDLATTCETEGGSKFVDFADQFLVNGWSTDEDAESTSIGWTLTAPITPLATASTSSDPGDWGPVPTPGHPADYADLATDPSGNIVIPDEPERPAAPSGSWGDTPTQVVMWRTWGYSAHHEVDLIDDHRDASLAGDDVKTNVQFSPTWSWTAMGTPVTGRTTTTADGAETYTYTLATGTFDSPGTVTQTAGGATRHWNYTYDHGQIASEEDPDGVDATYEYNDCGLLTSHTDAVGRTEAVTYDGCRKTSRTWQGATSTWSYDALGRITEASTDPGIGAVMTSWQVRTDDSAEILDADTPDFIKVYADDSVVESFLDGWGREVLSRTCYVEGASSLASTATIDDVDCGSGVAGAPMEVAEDRAIDVERGYAADGTLRFTSAPFEVRQIPGWSAVDVPVTSWTYADESGRPEVQLTPSPTVSGIEDWVTTETRYQPGEVSVTGPTRTCSVAYDTLDRSWDCEGHDRGSEERDAFGRLVREVEPGGVAWVTEYDGFGRPAHRYLDGTGVATFGGGTTFGATSWTWTSGDRRDSETDESGGVLRYQYTDGRLWDVIYQGSGLTPVTLSHLAYADAGSAPSFPALHVVATTDVNGNTSYTQYDGLDRVIGVMNPDASEASTTYDSRGRPASTTDTRGGTTTTGYDYADRAVTVTDPLGHTSTVDYDGAGRPLVATDADGVTAEVEYAYSGAPLTRWSGGKEVESFAYRADGFVSRHTVAGVDTALDYDDLGRRVQACVGYDDVTSCLSHDGQPLSWVYDSADRVEYSRLGTPSGGWRETHAFYNDLGWTTELVHPDATSEQFAYDEVGRLRHHSDEEGVVAETVYDGWGRPSSTVDHGRTTLFDYAFNQTGPLASSVADGTIPTTHLAYAKATAPDGSTSETWTDWAGRVAQSQDDEGTITASGFTGPDRSQVVRVSTAGDVLRWGYWHDAAGQMTARAGPMEDAVWSTVAAASSPPDPNAGGPYGFLYTYTDGGRLETRTGPNDDLTTWRWVDGRKAAELVGTPLNPDGITDYTWDYDDFGRPVFQGWGATRTTALTLDNQGRTEAVDEVDASGAIRTTYADFNEYGDARTVARLNGGPEESRSLFEFDARGRMTRVTQRADGVPFRDSVYGRGDDGLVESVTTPAGTLTFDRSPEREVDDVRVGTRTLARVTHRDAVGRATDFEMGDLGSTATLSRSFDTMGRLTGQTTTSATGDVDARSYDHDWQGRVDAVDVTFNGTPSLQIEHEYTLEGWLERETRRTPSGAGWATSVREHAYDSAGNRLSTEVDGVTEHTWTYEAGNKLSTVDGVAAIWSAQAQMTDDRGYAIDYAADGSVAGVYDTAAGVGYDFTRDPAGDPVQSDDGTGARTQAWGNPESDLPLFYDDPVTGTEAVVAIEGVELGRLAAGGASPFTSVATDSLGSVVMDGTTFVDVPEAFGAGADANVVASQRHVYAGLESLPGLPYQLARARVMDPTVGRFVSTDPAGLGGGDNRFVYANNEPTGLVDPGGLRFGRPSSAICHGWTCGPSSYKATHVSCQGAPSCVTYQTTSFSDPKWNADAAAHAQIAWAMSPETHAPAAAQEVDPARVASWAEHTRARAGDTPDARRANWLACSGACSDYRGTVAGTLENGQSYQASSAVFVGDDREMELRSTLEFLRRGGLDTPNQDPSASERLGMVWDNAVLPMVDRFSWQGVVESIPGSGVVGGIAGQWGAYVGDVETRGFGKATYSAYWQRALEVPGEMMAPFTIVSDAIAGVGNGIYGAGQWYGGSKRQFGNVYDVAFGDRRAATRGSFDMPAAYDQYTEGSDRVQSGVQSAMVLYGVYAGAAAILEGEGLAGTNPCANSFAPDTHVLTSEGWVPMSEVKEGDRVWACDDDSGLDCGWRRVELVIRGEHDALLRVSIEQADGSMDFLDVTPGHPFFVEGEGWTEAADLVPNDAVYSPWGAGSSVVDVRPLRRESVAINLSVALAHTYFVSGGDGDGVWVHNNGNSLASPNDQHLYEIWGTNPKSGQVELMKYGVSGGPETAMGMSVRAESQLADLAASKGFTGVSSKIVMRMPGPGARPSILASEKQLTRAYQASNPNGLRPCAMFRP